MLLKLSSTLNYQVTNLASFSELCELGIVIEDSKGTGVY